MNFCGSSLCELVANQTTIDYLNSYATKEKKNLSLGMLVPDAIQYICSEGQALRWDESASCYEVILAD